MLEQTSANLAGNIRRLRERRRITQQDLADLSGVPRPTIANLESGTANPTLSVLLKVADCLGASVEELVGAASARMVVHRVSTLPERRRGGASVRRLIPDSARQAEFERIEVAPGGKLAVRAEPRGAREVVACETGDVDLTVTTETVRLAPGDVATLPADEPRQYANRGKRPVTLYRLVVVTAG